MDCCAGYMLLAAATVVIVLLFFTFNTPKVKKRTKESTLKTVICIGSGGHTAEMLRILRGMNAERYRPRYYIVTDGDVVGERKVLDFERSLRSLDGEYEIEKIQRSRRVGQSYLTSIWTTLLSTFACIPMLAKIRPDVIFCNGPGTCVPVCVTAALLRLFRLFDCKMIFVESICRVKTLSLTGKILLYVVDVFAVQSEALLKLNKRIVYFGRLS